MCHDLFIYGYTAHCMGFCELACIQITLNGIPPVHGPFKLSSLLVMWAQTVISVWPSIDTCVCVCIREQAVPSWSQYCSVLHSSWGIVCVIILLSLADTNTCRHTLMGIMAILSRLLWECGCSGKCVCFHSCLYTISYICPVVMSVSWKSL